MTDNRSCMNSARIRSRSVLELSVSGRTKIRPPRFCEKVPVWLMLEDRSRGEGRERESQEISMTLSRNST